MFYLYCLSSNEDMLATYLYYYPKGCGLHEKSLDNADSWFPYIYYSQNKIRENVANFSKQGVCPEVDHERLSSAFHN